MENRVGEPAANPYLYLAAQLVGGLDGIAHELDPGPEDTDPYTAARAPLPQSLPEALDLLEGSRLFRQALGDTFVDYFVRIKRNEAGRFAAWLKESGGQERPDEPTAWEQNEYFDFF
jgi:glutamine synthetase